MKENKFLFYGSIVVTIACAMWLHFFMSDDIEFAYESETIESLDSMESDGLSPEEPKYTVSHKCETPRKIHHIIYERGNIITDEYDTYNAQCLCMVSIGNQKPVWFDLKYVDSTMFESKTADETTARCNDNCQTVCETGFKMFLDDNPDFKPFADGEFTGCSSQFELQSWAQETNGQSTERYYATNTITCNCASGDRTQEYQYFSESDTIETDCNELCPEICAE